MIKEIAFVCYPVIDLARARKFYEEVLGLKAPEVTETGGGTWIEYLIGDGAFALGKMDGFNPHADGGNLAFEVENFDEMIKSLKDQNVSFIMDSMETPVCHMAMIKDTEGNSLMIHKRKS